MSAGDQLEWSGVALSSLNIGRRKNHVAIQKGAVRVARPKGSNNTFIAACDTTVIITPSTAHRAERQQGR